MTRRWLVLFALLVPATAQDHSFADLIKRGREAYYAKDLDNALSLFAAARAKDGKRWEGHTWQALTLIHQALGETDRARRVAITYEAEAMTVELVKRSGLMFAHPLRQYILGICASLRDELERPVQILQKAYSAPRSMFVAFESIQLRKNVERAYGRALMDFGKRIIVSGRWHAASPVMARAAQVLPKDDPGWAELERSLAVLDEALNRWQSAIKRLHRCIELSDKPDVKLELTGTIAQIYFKNQRYDEGIKALAEVPKDSKHPEILAARCTALMHPALRGSRKDPRVDKALAFFREAMKTYPEDDIHRLLEDYTQIVLHKVGVREAKAERALLEDNVRRLLIEMKIRPECPSIYFQLYQLYKLLRNQQKEIEFQALHAKAKVESKGKARFNELGRPRCR